MSVATPAKSSQFTGLVRAYAIVFAAVLLYRARSLSPGDAGLLITCLAIACSILAGVDTEALHDAFLFTFVFSFLWARDPCLRCLVVLMQITVLVWWKTHQNKCPFFAHCDESRQISSENSRFMLMLTVVVSAFMLPSNDASAHIKVLMTLVAFMVYKVGVEMSRLKLKKERHRPITSAKPSPCRRVALLFSFGDLWKGAGLLK